jgi:ATP-binding cassette, subfamily B, bacterial
MLVAAAAMLWYDAVLFLLVLALAPVIWIINRTFHRRLSEALRAMRESWSRVVATLAESVIGVRVTQGFVRQEENSRVFADLAEDHSTYNTAVLRTQGVFVPLLELNSQLFIAVLLLVGGYRVLVPDAGTGVGDLVAFFFMANLFFSPVSVLGNQYNQAMTAMAGAERVFSFLDTPPDWTDPPDALDIPPLVGRVEFQNVTFSYEPDRPVLFAASFIAEPGQTIALVGHTGSGKTTITNLISKFYLPDRGRVLVDDCDLMKVSSRSLHQQMGLVLQQNFLFHATVADNIRVGKPGASDAEVIEAVRRLDCLDLLENLPQGFQTNVGERGVVLSSGQRQLICFARALLADPRILILDEATSSIDTQTESRLQAALAVLLRGRTSFVVAHRLSTIRGADQVLVLENGRIVESGDHDSLLGTPGVYSALYGRFIQSAAG